MAEGVTIDESAIVELLAVGAFGPFLHERGEKIAALARSFAPVDTGRLKDSIEVIDTDNCVYVGSPVEYAIYQELGTRFQPGTPFLRPALYASVGL